MSCCAATLEDLDHLPASIAALLLDHGVDEFLTMDRDFHRFAGLRITVPFV